MTVTEAINAANILRKDNNCTEEQKLEWLTKADERNNEILSFYKGTKTRTDFELWYTAENEDGTQLLVPDRFAQMYIHFLCAQIDFLNSDIQKYNNESALYNQLFNDWCAWLNRNYLHKGNQELKITGWL